MRLVIMGGEQQGFKIFSRNGLLASGFFLCMIVMELALEGANNEFPSLAALPYAVTLFQFGFCFLLPLFLSRGNSLETFPKTTKEALPYVSLSLVVFGSTCFASMSVRYVSYPTKVVLKSAKLIPTMIVATFLQRGNRYGVLDYVAAALLCAGAAGYSWGSGSPSPRQGGNDGSSTVGIVLLLISIFCDAFTPNIQQRLMAPPTSTGVSALPSTSTNNGDGTEPFVAKIKSIVIPGGLGLSASALMTNANGVGCIGLLLYMAISGSLTEALGAAFLHPFLLVYLTIIGLSLSLAVMCYTRLIKDAGSVVAVAVATLRKVATVVLSYLVYPKSFSSIHAVSAILVLAGILLNSYTKQRSNK